MFHGTLRSERRVFFWQAPCISQAPFHVPICRGYQGGARLSKMDCSDTTQSLQVALVRQFKIHGFGSQCESPIVEGSPPVSLQVNLNCDCNSEYTFAFPNLCSGFTVH